MNSLEGAGAPHGFRRVRQGRVLDRGISQVDMKLGFCCWSFGMGFLDVCVFFCSMESHEFFFSLEKTPLSEIFEYQYVIENLATEL